MLHAGLQDKTLLLMGGILAFSIFMKKYSLLICLLLVFSCSSGDALDGTIPEIDLNNNSLQDSVFNCQDDTIRILSIGNSASQDAFSYVPYLFHSITRKTIKVGILYYPYANLKTHWDLKNKNECTYYYCNNSGEPWNSTKKTNIIETLNSEDWDIITFQHTAKDALNDNTYHPYLENLVQLVRENSKPNIVLGWFLSPAYPNGYSYLRKEGINSDELYNNVIKGNLNNIETLDFSFIIPAATATQNARHTELGTLGNYGQLCFDGLHLQEGLPCQIEAYTICQSLINWYGIDAKITSDNTLVTDKWLSDKNIPGIHGKSTGTSYTDLSRAKSCVMKAIENPYNLSF